MIDPNLYSDLAELAVNSASDLYYNKFASDLSVSATGDKDIKTLADSELSKFLVDFLHRHSVYPVFSEESPLDIPFLQNLPLDCRSN